jgi:LacI family transcriptional regulator
LVKRTKQRVKSGSGSVTLRDVARVAKTTPMTVSNALNNRLGTVSHKVAGHIKEVAKELGYRPHASARRLRSQRHQAIGVILVDPSPYYLSDPLTAAMLAGLTAGISDRVYSTVLLGVAPLAVNNARLLQSIETDGICLILSGSKDKRQETIEKIRLINQPVVLIQESLPDQIRDGACVYQDDRHGARELARHLLQQPAKHAVMLIPNLEWPAMVRREQGMRDVFDQSDVTTELFVTRSKNEGFEACQAALAEHIKIHGRPDILIGGNDQMAIAGMKYLQGQGLRVPTDVKVAGFNGLEFWRYPTPEITTVISPAFSIGETAGRVLLERLATGVFPFRELILPSKLAIHGSTETTIKVPTKRRN